MMDKLLGIDYGERKIGVAYAETPLAEPLEVIRYKEKGELIAKLKNIVRTKGVEKVVVGVSEGLMARQSKEFGEQLSEALSLPVEYVSEVLSTSDAQSLSIMAGIKRKKRKEMEDAYAAALILQKYLDIQA